MPSNGTGLRAAITGVGYTEFSNASGRSVLALAREACAEFQDTLPPPWRSW